MKKNKQELIKEANVLAEEHLFKKSVIEKLLSDLDMKNKFSEEHITGMANAQDLLSEMDEIAIKYEEILKQIKE